MRDRSLERTAAILPALAMQSDTSSQLLEYLKSFSATLTSSINQSEAKLDGLLASAAKLDGRLTSCEATSHALFLTLVSVC